MIQAEFSEDSYFPVLDRVSWGWDTQQGLLQHVCVVPQLCTSFLWLCVPSPHSQLEFFHFEGVSPVVGLLIWHLASSETEPRSCKTRPLNKSGFKF